MRGIRESVYLPKFDLVVFNNFLNKQHAPDLTRVGDIDGDGELNRCLNANRF